MSNVREMLGHMAQQLREYGARLKAEGKDEDAYFAELNARAAEQLARPPRVAAPKRDEGEE